MKKIVYSTLTLALLSLNAYGYDTTKAQELEGFYSHMTQEACANSKLFVTGEETMKMIREESVTLLDVRTQGEASVISVSAKNAIHIPISELFKKENLDKIPTDKPIVVICHSGSRAILAGVGLKRIGFQNVQILKGGLVALATDNNTQNAPLK